MAKKEFEIRHGLISGSTIVIDSAGNWVGNTITETKGGTAQTTYAAGDLLYASGVDTLTKLTAGSNTEILTLAGGVPTWAAPAGTGSPTDQLHIVGGDGITVTTGSPEITIAVDSTVARMGATSALANVGTFRLTNGSPATTYVDFTHDGSDFNTDFTNTDLWNVSGTMAQFSSTVPAGSPTGDYGFLVTDTRSISAGDNTALLKLNGTYTGSNQARTINGLDIEMNNSLANFGGSMINTVANISGTQSFVTYTKYDITNDKFNGAAKVYDGVFEQTNVPTTSRNVTHMHIQSTYPVLSSANWNHRIYNIYSDLIIPSDWNNASNVSKSRNYGIYSKVTAFQSDDFVSYNLYLDTVNAHATHYGLYQNQSGVINYFAGDTGFGIDTPEQAVDVSGTLRIRDGGDTDWADLSHDGTDFNATFTNTADWNITGANLSLGPDATQPWLTLDSTSSGDAWDAQGAGISVGEGGKKGGTAVHMTYNGSGQGYIGMGAVDDTTTTGGRPAQGHLEFNSATTILRLRELVEVRGDTNPYFRIYGPNGSNYVAFTHDNTNLDTAFTNTTDWNITGLTGDLIFGGSPAIFQSTTAAAGGLLARNTLTGTGLERVLTTSDLVSAGSPTDQLHVVGGDGITVTVGSPDVTVAVDSTVARGGDNISTFVNDANYLTTIGSPFLDIRGGSGITIAFGSPRVTITNSDPNVDQNLWLNMDADSGGPVAANTTSDTFTFTGGTGISTAIAGDVVTITATGSPFTVSSLQEVTDVGATTTNAVTITNATSSTTDTTGALIVTGGIGVAENVNVGGTLELWDSTNADSASFSHDGTDFNTTLTNTTDWNITGANINLGDQTRFYFESRTMPTVIADTVDIGVLNVNAGGYVIKLDVVVTDSGFSVAKSYTVAVNYAETVDVWEELVPFSDGGAYSGNNYAVDIKVNNATVSLRLRRTAGATAGTASCTLQVTTDNVTYSWAPSSTTSAVGSPAGIVYYAATGITVYDNTIDLVHNTNIIGGNTFAIEDSTGSDNVAFSHDGTDFNIVGTNTTDINITSGITAVNLPEITLTTTLDETYGGTGQTTFATGDILYASGANVLAKLAVGSNTEVLTLTGGVPTWVAPAAGTNAFGTITGDSGTIPSDKVGDTVAITGGTGVTTSVTGSPAVLVITNDSPNVDQNIWLNMDADSGGPVAANITTDTFTITGGTSITTSISGDAVTIVNDAPNVDQNLWLNIAANSGGPVAANTTTDTLTIAGGAGINTVISGDTVTVSVTGSPLIGDPDQNLWLNMDADSGGPVAANTTTDTFTITGGASITTSISGDAVTIVNDSPNVDQNLWLNMDADSGGPVAANITTDTFTITGGTGITTAISGDAVTITRDALALNDLSDVTAVGSPTGQLLYSDGTNWVALSKGTNGQVLTMGSPLLPVWQPTSFTETNDLSSSVTWTTENRVLTNINTATPPTTEAVVGSFEIYDNEEVDLLAEFGFVGNNEVKVRNYMRGGDFVFSGVNAAGTTIEFLDWNPDGVTLFRSADNMAMYVDSTQQFLQATGGSITALYHNGIQTIQTATTALGGLVVDNDWNGQASFERVLTESDIHRGLPIGLYSFQSGIGAGNPGAGKVGFDSATPASITLCKINDASISSWNMEWLYGQLAIGDLLIFASEVDTADYITFTVDGITDSAGHWDIDVTYVAGGTIFGNSEFIRMTWVPVSQAALPNIVGGTGITVATGSPQFTITNSDPNVDQNLWLNMDADSGGPVAANTTSDTFTLTGGTGITTAIAGDVVTITRDAITLGTDTTGDFVGTITGGVGIDSTGATTGEDIDHTLSVDLGEVTAVVFDPAVDFMPIIDGGITGTTQKDAWSDIATLIAGTNITASAGVLSVAAPGDPDQNLWLNIGADSGGPVAANTTTDTLTIAGGVGISTAIAGDTITITNDTGGSPVIPTLIVVTDESADTTCFPVFVTAATGNLQAKTGSNITFNSATGHFTATSKSFLIDHPTKPGKKLQYGSLEGPELGIYIRGHLRGSRVIELPDYWSELADPDSITVNLTPNGKQQTLYVEKIGNNTVYVGGNAPQDIDCFYTIFAVRADIDKLVVED